MMRQRSAPQFRVVSFGYKQAALSAAAPPQGDGPLGNGQFVTVVHDGAAVVVFSRHLRQRCQHVQLRNSICCPLDAVELGADAFQQFAEQAVLQRDEPFVGT